ncbi:MAG: hypothetical protein ACRD8K_05235 [Nitrososphaeraceae archaeon]
MIFFVDKNHLTEYDNCNIEIVLNNAISAALLDLDPLKDYYYNKHLLLEIEILRGMIDITQNICNNLHFLKQLVNKKINNYKVEYNYAQNIEERDKLLKSIEILGTCLFLINIKLGSHHLYPINGLLKK